MTRVRCPDCHRDTALWVGVEVPGWQAVNSDLTPAREREADWPYALPDGTAGCGECGWEGLDRGAGGLERLGLDGCPLPVVHPRQETLA